MKDVEGTEEAVGGGYSAVRKEGPRGSCLCAHLMGESKEEGDSSQ